MIVWLRKSLFDFLIEKTDPNNFDYLIVDYVTETDLLRDRDRPAYYMIEIILLLLELADVRDMDHRGTPKRAIRFQEINPF